MISGQFWSFCVYTFVNIVKCSLLEPSELVIYFVSYFQAGTAQKRAYFCVRHFDKVSDSRTLIISNQEASYMHPCYT